MFLTKMSASMIKYIAGVNLYRERNVQINFSLVTNEYLRYLVKED